MEIPKHYNNDNGSLYKIAEERGWNAYQFDIIKRIDRALKKGEFVSDLEKTKTVIDIWLNEREQLTMYENMIKFNEEFEWVKEPVNLSQMNCDDTIVSRPICKHMADKDDKTE